VIIRIYCAVRSRDLWTVLCPVSWRDQCRDYLENLSGESIGDLFGEYSGDPSRETGGDSRFQIPDLRLQIVGVANSECRTKNKERR
jgi:hypothetical protein